MKLNKTYTGINYYGDISEIDDLTDLELESINEKRFFTKKEKVVKIPNSYSFKDFNDYDSHIFDGDAVKTSIRNILLTPKGSLPGKPDFGSNLHKMVFEQLDYILNELITIEIKEVLGRWEPRVIVDNVETFSYAESPNLLQIEINYHYALEEIKASNSVVLDFDIFAR